VHTPWPPQIRAWRGLQATLQPVNRESTVIAAQQLEMRDKSFRQSPGKVFQLTSDQLPSISNTEGHCVKLDARS
jgi:hypothetical protein